MLELEPPGGPGLFVDPVEHNAGSQCPHLLVAPHLLSSSIGHHGFLSGSPSVVHEEYSFPLNLKGKTQSAGVRVPL